MRRACRLSKLQRATRCSQIYVLLGLRSPRLQCCVMVQYLSFTWLLLSMGCLCMLWFSSIPSPGLHSSAVEITCVMCLFFCCFAQVAECTASACHVSRPAQPSTSTIAPSSSPKARSSNPWAAYLALYVPPSIYLAWQLFNHNGACRIRGCVFWLLTDSKYCRSGMPSPSLAAAASLFSAGELTSSPSLLVGVTPRRRRSRGLPPSKHNGN